MHFLFLFFWAFVFHQIDSNLGTMLVVRPIPQCISVKDFNKASAVLCENRTNATLWQQLVDCHVPMSEEYLRKSSAANCPMPLLVDPADTTKSIWKVFLNFCTLGVGPNFLHNFMGEHCYVYGRRGQAADGRVSVLPHNQQSALSQKIYGDDILCKVGKCILGMG